MYAWALAVVAIGLVAGVLGFSVLASAAQVESRILVVGFLAFFVVSLIAGAGLVPVPSIDGGSSPPTQTASMVNFKGESR